MILKNIRKNSNISNNLQGKNLERKIRFGAIIL